eukprot:94019_1
MPSPGVRLPPTYPRMGDDNPFSSFGPNGNKDVLQSIKAAADGNEFTIGSEIRFEDRLDLGDIKANDRDTQPDRARELSMREEQLKRREKDLDRRLRNAASNARNGESSAKPNNWPHPRFAPWFYHNIDAEIPTFYQMICRHLYYHWTLCAACLAYNALVVPLAAFGGGGIGSSPTSLTFKAVFYGVVGIIVSWRVWYISAYRAFRDAKSRYWLIFFVCFFAHCIWWVLMALGLPGSGSLGLFTLIDMLAVGKGAAVWAVLAIPNTLVSAFNACCAVYLLKKAHMLYRAGGGANQARKDLTREVARRAVEGTTQV